MPELVLGTNYSSTGWKSFFEFANKNFVRRERYKQDSVLSISVKSFEDSEGKTVFLKKPIKISAYKQGDYYSADFNDLDLHYCEPSKEDLLIAVSEELSMIKETYMDCDEAELSRSAIDFKKKAAEYF